MYLKVTHFVPVADVEGFHGDELAELLRTPGLQIEATDEVRASVKSCILKSLHKNNKNFKLKRVSLFGCLPCQLDLPDAVVQLVPMKLCL